MGRSAVFVYLSPDGTGSLTHLFFLLPLHSLGMSLELSQRDTVRRSILDQIPAARSCSGTTQNESRRRLSVDDGSPRSRSREHRRCGRGHTRGWEVLVRRGVGLGVRRRVSRGLEAAGTGHHVEHVGTREAGEVHGGRGACAPGSTRMLGKEGSASCWLCVSHAHLRIVWEGRSLCCKTDQSNQVAEDDELYLTMGCAASQVRLKRTVPDSKFASVNASLVAWREWYFQSTSEQLTVLRPVTTYACRSSAAGNLADQDVPRKPY
jgi:hypothetical protein